MSNCAIHKLCGEIVPGIHKLIYLGSPNLLIPVCTQCACKYDTSPKLRELLNPLLEAMEEKERTRLDAQFRFDLEERGISWPTDPDEYLAALEDFVQRHKV